MSILRSAIRSARHRAAMAPLFNHEYYKTANPDVSGGRRALFRHYVSIGWKLGFDPSEQFSTTRYLIANPDVADAGINPLLHYVLHGKSEGRSPNPPAVDLDVPTDVSEHFDEEFYKAQLSGIPLLGLRPIQHYLLRGWRLGLNPSPDFDGDFYLSANPDVAAADINPLVHWVTKGKEEGRLSTSSGDDDCYLTAWHEGLFDPDYYLNTYEDVARRKFAPLRHYKLHGWQEYRNPSAAFDAVWYSHMYMADQAEPMDPLLHYMQHGRHQGYRTKPPKSSTQPEISGEFPADGRRVCLFAGYDAEGIIDDAVQTYIRELAEYADVYYLADCAMDQSELDKLSEITKGAWAKRHGTYDFGSWALLANEFVGWDSIDAYDELLLVNDSAFLVKPLEDVFRRMDGIGCAWWGLQATKGIAATFEKQGLRGSTAVSLSERRMDLLDRFEDDPIYDFLIGSYFVAFRKPVIDDTIFRKIINGIRQEKNKSTIIRKYEIGIGRWLVSKGYQFETFVDELYPWQPIYTETAFDLIEQGFPLFKRYLLTDNHYNVPYLNCWRERLIDADVSVDLDAIWENTVRNGDYGKLLANLHLGDDQDGNPVLEPPLARDQIATYDKSAPKFNHWWVFPVCAFTHALDDNTRAVFESVKMDAAITKIILTRSKQISAEGVNVRVVSKDSRLGQYYMARARHVFIKHTVRSNFGNDWDPKERNFYNLWHGIPLKRIGYASLDRKALLADTADQNRRLKSVICASDVDRLAMAAAHFPLTYHDMWKTGLPRHDFILMASEYLPEDLRAQEQRLQEMLAGRKLVFFAPTFRNDQNGGYYRFTEDEVVRLSNWLDKNNAVFGIREHMADTSRQYSSQLRGSHFLDLSSRRFSDVEVIYRLSDMLITDYSSCYIDFSLTGRPVISFAFDAEAYAGVERGLFYDLKWAFPGEVVESFDELLDAIDQAAASPYPSDSYLFKRKIYCDYVDTENTWRVVRRVLENELPNRLPQIIMSPGEDGRKILCISISSDGARKPAEAVKSIVEHHGLAIQWAKPSDIRRVEFGDCAAVVFINITADDDVLDLCELASIQGIPIVYVEQADPAVVEKDIVQLSADKAKALKRLTLRSACGHGRKRQSDELNTDDARLNSALEQISACDEPSGANWWL